MVRLLLVAVAVLAVGSAFAGPVAEPTTPGPEVFHLEDAVGKWWSYCRYDEEYPYLTASIEITKKTPEQIAEYREQWYNHSMPHDIETILPKVEWSRVNFHGVMKVDKRDYTDLFLIEKIKDMDIVRILSSDKPVTTFRYEYSDGTLRLRMPFVGFKMLLYRTLPDLPM